jgi:hypothetical protein
MKGEQNLGSLGLGSLGPWSLNCAAAHCWYYVVRTTTQLKTGDLSSRSSSLMNRSSSPSAYHAYIVCSILLVRAGYAVLYVSLLLSSLSLPSLLPSPLRSGRLMRRQATTAYQYHSRLSSSRTWLLPLAYSVRSPRANIRFILRTTTYDLGGIWVIPKSAV